MTSALQGERIEPETFTCRELVALVTAYLDGALSDPERHQFEEHLARCDGCTRHVEQMQITVATLGRLREDDFPSDVRTRFLAAFRDWNREGS